MTLAITTVSTSIAALSVAGVTICDLGNIPPSGERVCPILFPDPENPISNLTVTRQSYGGGSSRLEDAEYDLNYIYLHCELGAGRTGLDFIEAAVQKVQLIFDAIEGVDVLSGAVDISFSPGIRVATIVDPSLKQYLGSNLTFHVTEFWR
jgi:hypothetical protein